MRTLWLSCPALLLPLLSCGILNGASDGEFRSFVAGGPSDPKAEGEGEFQGDVACSGNNDHIRCIELTGGLCDDLARFCAPADFVTNQCAESLAVGGRTDVSGAPFVFEAFGDPGSLQIGIADLDGDLPDPAGATDVVVEGTFTDVTVTTTSYVELDALPPGNQQGFLILDVTGSSGTLAIAVVDDDGNHSNAICFTP